MKLERLISMIYMLLNNEILSASALAEKYNVSQRTIYRDIDAICAAGIPVVSYQGVNGGYGIMEQYKMDKSLLGSYDVGSLITILHSMSTVFDDERALDTIHRLQTIQSGPNRQSLTMDIGNRQIFNEPLRLVRSAISERCVIRFDYVNLKNEKTSRKLEPIRLMYKNSVWYVYGFCRTRQDYREFRISRMVDLVTTAETFQPHAEKEQECKERSYEGREERQRTDVVLHCSAASLARAMDHFYDADKCFNEDGSLTLTLKVYKPVESEWLVAILLSFGEGLEIVEPLELREAFKAKLEKMLKRY
ncbi:helix-turn-helix transcriptional regulator [Paenibacillus rigui]|uniref:Transcriptional regulator n=1 Tax=Paenibacillus rigui TaxID=554312 RepID=A0A229UM37_9BACL|nr:YafY family protein [Paenibacillus rigui]OXM84508.1 transcriptional regulator [Paenibacillus rigui]